MKIIIHIRLMLVMSLPAFLVLLALQVLLELVLVGAEVEEASVDSTNTLHRGAQYRTKVCSLVSSKPSLLAWWHRPSL